MASDKEKIENDILALTRMAQLNSLCKKADNQIRSGDFAGAEMLLKKVLGADPDHADAVHLMGLIALNIGHYKQAAELITRAINRTRDNYIFFNNLGFALQGMGKLKDASRAFEQAIRLNPNIAESHYNLGILQLLTGDLRNGWKEHEWRLKIRDLVPTHSYHQKPMWGGEPLEGRTILLHAEQGYGDTLNFIRYVQLVKQAGGRIIVECQPSLKRLLDCMPDIDHIIAQGEPQPDFDVHAPMMSLPYIFGTTTENIPADIPYLKGNDLPAETCEKLGLDDRNKNIGIVWRANPAYRNDLNRSFELSCFRPLLLTPKTKWFSLQYGERAADISTTEGMDNINDLSPFLDDFLDTASIIKQLDLVITVDTSVAHLAGALGAPVWVILSSMPDWRWLLDRDDSPWYPGMRLFRQSSLGDWKSVFEKVRIALESYT